MPALRNYLDDGICSHPRYTTPSDIAIIPRFGHIYSYLMMQMFQGRYIPDLCEVAHVDGWELHNLHDLRHASWLRSVLYAGPAEQNITAG